MNIFPINDSSKAIKLFSSNEHELFMIGYKWSPKYWYGDIVIRKKEFMNQCQCIQSSFQYTRKRSVLVGRNKPFEIERFILFQMRENDSYSIPQEPIQRKIQLQWNEHLSRNERKQLEHTGKFKFIKRIMDSDQEYSTVSLVSSTTKLIKEYSTCIVLEDTNGNKYCFSFIKTSSSFNSFSNETIINGTFFQIQQNEENKELHLLESVILQKEYDSLNDLFQYIQNYKKKINLIQLNQKESFENDNLIQINNSNQDSIHLNEIENHFQLDRFSIWKII